MSKRLEEEVSCRVKNKSVLYETHSDQEEAANTNTNTNTNALVSQDSYAGAVEDQDVLCSLYRDFFQNLKLAIDNDDDPAKSFQFLKHARSIAKELTT